MLRPSSPELKVYLHRAPIDMRTGRNGLAALSREVLKEDPFSAQALFVFVGKRYNSMKILAWDRNGFSVWHKVIESQERFHWPRLMQEEAVSVTGEQLAWLMDGYDVWAQPHRMLKFSHVT